MTHRITTPGPFCDTLMAKYLRDHHADHPEIADHEIARHLGYDRDSVVAALRDGQVKLPLDKAASLAEVLKADPIAVTRLALEQFGLLRDDTLGRFFDRMATANEQVLLDAYRKAVEGADYPLSPETIEDITALIGSAYRRSANARQGHLEALAE